MNNKEFAKILEKRTQKFAANIVLLSKQLPHSPEGMRIRDQLTGSGTSVGANYREANRAQGRRNLLRTLFFFPSNFHIHLRACVFETN